MNIESLSEYQAYFYNAQIFVTAVMVLICLLAFVNLLNTCITNTVIRRHDYALLEAAGMTKVQIYQTQNAENRIYFLGSLIRKLCSRHTVGVLLMQRDCRNTRIVLYFLSVSVVISAPVFRA